MYKILIKYPSDKVKNLYQSHGTTTTSATGEPTFTEFSTDDVDTLKAELTNIDKKFGFENIKVIKEVEVNYSVDVN